ncbi:hypothetical protein BN1044_00041, partial [Hafnia alvei]
SVGPKGAGQEAQRKLLGFKSSKEPQSKDWGFLLL